MRNAGRFLNCAVLTAAVAVAAAGAGCRRVDEDRVRQIGTRLFGAPNSSTSIISTDRDPLGLGGSDDSASIVMRELQQGPQEDYHIIVEPEDTLNLYSEWSGVPVAELLRTNPSVRDSGLIPGSSFNLKLSAGVSSKFKGLRDAYKARVRQKRQSGIEIVRDEKHVVEEGESLQDILSRYSTRIDLVEKLNPQVRLLNIRKGDVLTIPITGRPGEKTETAEGGSEVRERLPGPSAPNPAPVPVPPAKETKKLLVDGPAPIVRDNPERRQSSAQAGTRRPHTVKKGDSGWSLCRLYKVTASELQEANPGVDLSQIRPGQKLMIPVRKVQAASHP